MQSIYDDEDGECETCGQEVSQNQLDAYDGECGRCHFNQEKDEDGKTYRTDEEIRSGSRSHSGTNIIEDKWTADEGEKAA